MITNKFQVAIIGGGLGGLTLAIQLVNAGYSCVLFEKNKYPFHRVCGEYISMESWDFLKRIGAGLANCNLPKINRLHVSSPSGTLLKQELDLGGFGISRYQLDNQLYQLAKQKGVQVLEQCKVTQCIFQGENFIIQSTAGSFTARLCVGAWGKKSNMDEGISRAFTQKIKKKKKNYIGIKYHVKLPFADDLIELHNFENGYCGISKIENDACCLCYLTAAENLKKHKGDIKEMEAVILKKNPFLKKYLESAVFLFEEPLAISQIRIGYKSAVENNILMIGDAAGNIAPLSGNGMSMAMRSSFVLNELISDYLNGRISRNELHDRYVHFWKMQLKKQVQFSTFLHGLLKNKALINGTIRLLKAVPILSNALVRSTHGKPF